jgi:hypothetical protein
VEFLALPCSESEASDWLADSLKIDAARNFEDMGVFPPWLIA